MTAMTKLRRRRRGVNDEAVAMQDTASDIIVPVDGVDGGSDGAVVPSVAPATVPRRTSRRGWGDRLVRALLVLAIALAAFAGGRFSVQRGPETLAEAMTQFRAGELPAGEQAAGGGMGGMGGGFGAPGGMPGGGAAISGAPTNGAPAGAPAGATTTPRPAG